HGQIQVEQHQVEWAQSREEFDSLLAIRCLDHLVSLAVQELCDQLPQEVLILDQQELPGSFSVHVLLLRQAGPIDRLMAARFRVRPTSPFELVAYLTGSGWFCPLEFAECGLPSLRACLLSDSALAVGHSRLPPPTRTRAEPGNASVTTRHAVAADPGPAHG